MCQLGVYELTSLLQELVRFLEEDARGVVYPRLELEERSC